MHDHAFIVAELAVTQARDDPPGRREAVFLGSRVVVLSKRPGTVVLDLPVPLPRGDVDADELRGSAEFAELRARIAHEVKAAAV